MKYQPNRNYVSNDVIYTPDDLALSIVSHFKPTGRILEPCRGGGAFTRAMPGCDWCEISDGKDFMDAKGHYDWIVTNPPWSKIRDFMCKSFQLADNVVFLMTINHAFTKARIRLMKEYGFGMREILFLDTPKNFPQSGFQLGAVHYKEMDDGICRMTYKRNRVGVMG